MLLRDADVDVLCAERRAVFGGETNAADDARREIDEVRIFPCRPQDEIDGRGVVCARRFGGLCRARIEVKGLVPVPALGIVLGKGKPLALLRHDVDDDGLLRILDLGKDADQLLRVVAVHDEAVVEVHRTK